MMALGAVMNTPYTHLIADLNNIKKRVDELKHRSDDIKSRIAFTLKNLWNPERTIRAVSENTDLTQLRQTFPHFSEVIDFYENSIITLARLELPFEAPPVLLQGDPGLGKTYFASEFAKLINIPFFEISLASTSSSFGLSGGNLQWSEGSTGFVANTLASSEVANPFILIDEIDKSAIESRYSPMNVFYSLLESHSAKRFKDEALEFELDASKIIWIATANYSNNIPAPIKSRMRIFEITQPSPELMPSVIKSIYRHLIETKSYGKILDNSLCDSVIELLAYQSPRAVKLVIEEAAFKAIRNQRCSINAEDLPRIVKEKNRVGFI
jgi:ATP-dependent Lon protease